VSSTDDGRERVGGWGESFGRDGVSANSRICAQEIGSGVVGLLVDKRFVVVRQPGERAFSLPGSIGLLALLGTTSSADCVGSGPAARVGGLGDGPFSRQDASAPVAPECSAIVWGRLAETRCALETVTLSACAAIIGMTWMPEEPVR